MSMDAIAHEAEGPFRRAVTDVARWRRPLTGAVLAVAVSIGLAGCDTMSDDLQDVGGSLFMPSPGEAALMATDEYDADKRREGTLLLSNAPFGGDPKYIKLYRLRVEVEQDPLVLAVAIRALGKHGTPEDVLLIMPHLQDENVQVRWEAAKGLQRLHNPIAVVPLLDVLRSPDEDSDVRLAAAIALGQYPEDRSFQGLVGALNARELSVNLGASASLETMTGQTLGLDAREWLAWYEDHPDEAFANGKEFLYPTYQREDSLLEKIVFWTEREQELPAPPAGLRSDSEARTYEDSEAAEPSGDADAPATSTEGGQRTYADSPAPDADADATSGQ